MNVPTSLSQKSPPLVLLYTLSERLCSALGGCKLNTWHWNLYTWHDFQSYWNHLIIIVQPCHLNSPVSSWNKKLSRWWKFQLINKESLKKHILGKMMWVQNSGECMVTKLKVATINCLIIHLRYHYTSVFLRNANFLFFSHWLESQKAFWFQRHRG